MKNLNPGDPIVLEKSIKGTPLKKGVFGSIAYVGKLYVTVEFALPSANKLTEDFIFISLKPTQFKKVGN